MNPIPSNPGDLGPNHSARITTPTATAQNHLDTRVRYPPPPPHSAAPQQSTHHREASLRATPPSPNKKALPKPRREGLLLLFIYKGGLNEHAPCSRPTPQQAQNLRFKLNPKPLTGTACRKVALQPHVPHNQDLAVTGVAHVQSLEPIRDHRRNARIFFPDAQRASLSQPPAAALARAFSPSSCR